jgi:hypothetical protein
MDLLLYGCAGILGGVVGATLLYILVVKRTKKQEIAASSVRLNSEDQVQKQHKCEKLVREIDERLKKVEEESKQKTAEKKFAKLERDVLALENKCIRPMSAEIEPLSTAVEDLQPYKRDDNRTPTPSSKGEEYSPPPAPQKAGEVRSPIPVKAAEEESRPPATQLFEVPSPGEIIIESFDDVDALTMRRIDRMRQEYEKRLGSALIGLYEREGAYVFLMKDQTAHVHPKPNSPLPRFWERAFSGATSYSRPIRRVYKAAVVGQADGEYEVIEKGGFDVT